MRVTGPGFRYRSTLALAAGLLILSSCASDPTEALDVQGTVDADTVTISVPAIAEPEVDLNAGFTSTSDSSDGSANDTRHTSRQPTMSLKVTTVMVKLGQRVTAGAPLAKLDSRALDADVTAAQAAHGAASAQVAALRQTRADLDDKRASLQTAKGKIDQALVTLTSQRSQVNTRLATARRQLAALPTSAPPSQAAAIAKARAQLQSAITQLTAAQAKLDAGLASARTQRAQLNSASAQVSQALTQVGSLIDLAQVSVAAADVSLKQARLAASLTTVTAPVSGTVIAAPTVGTVLAAGATLVELRETPLTITTWLSPSDAERVCTGDAATVTADWMDGSRAGEISTIGASAEYPPTSQSSSDLHLTRAFRVTVQVDGTDPLPPGGPTDMSLNTCQTER